MDKARAGTVHQAVRVRVQMTWYSAQRSVFAIDTKTNKRPPATTFMPRLRYTQQNILGELTTVGNLHAYLPHFTT